MTKKLLRHALSATFALLVVALLVVASPVEAVKLKVQAPTNAQQGNKVPLLLGIDLEEGDQLPLSVFTLVREGPGGKQVCTFNLQGKPLRGCEGYRIDFIRNLAEPLGYGYGFGPYNGKDMEVVFKVYWNTEKRDAGQYTFRLWTAGEEKEFRSPDVKVLLKKKEKKECTEARERNGECKREPKEEPEDCKDLKGNERTRCEEDEDKK